MWSVFPKRTIESLVYLSLVPNVRFKHLCCICTMVSAAYKILDSFGIIVNKFNRKRVLLKLMNYESSSKINKKKKLIQSSFSDF